MQDEVDSDVTCNKKQLYLIFLVVICKIKPKGERYYL